MHDKNGNSLSVGDDVVLRAKISALHGGEHDCNANFQITDDSDEPQGYLPSFTGNTKLCEKNVVIDSRLTDPVVDSRNSDYD